MEFLVADIIAAQENIHLREQNTFIRLHITKCEIMKKIKCLQRNMEQRRKKEKILAAKHSKIERSIHQLH